MQFDPCAVVPDFSPIFACTENSNIYSAHWKRLKAIVTIADTWEVSGALNVFNTELSAYNNYEVGAIIISVTDEETKHRACLQVTGPEVIEPSSKFLPHWTQTVWPRVQLAPVLCPTPLKPSSGSSRIHRSGEKNRNHNLHDGHISSSRLSLHTINYTLL